MIFEKEADILAQTYYHRATVKRPTHMRDGYFDDYTDEILYEDIPCAISFKGGSTTGESDTTQRIEYTSTFFGRPELRIEAGDIVIADIFGVEYTYLCGEGTIYQSHIEIPLIRSDEA